MKEKILHKREKPSREPSTPKMAFLVLKCDFYVYDITINYWRPHGESNPGYSRERAVS